MTKKEKKKLTNIRLEGYEMPPSIRGLCGIRSKQSLLQLLFETVKQLNNADMLNSCQTYHNYENTFFISFGDMARLFFNINDKKIISFVFPFHIEKIDDNSFRICDRQTDTIIDARVTSLLKNIFSADIFSKEFYSPNPSMEDIIIDALGDLESLSLKDYPNIWPIVQNLLLFESGYIRYDHDEEHAKGKIHPIDHFDVNYSNQASFKLGLHQKEKVKFIVDFMDKKSDSLFLS